MLFTKYLVCKLTLIYVSFNESFSNNNNSFEYELFLPTLNLILSYVLSEFFKITLFFIGFISNLLKCNTQILLLLSSFNFFFNNIKVFLLSLPILIFGEQLEFTSKNPG